MPVTGPLDRKDTRSPRTDEVNHPGYYAATLSRYNVKAELTSTRRVGSAPLHLRDSVEDAHITVDIAHCLTKGSGSESQRFLGGEVHMLSNRESK